MTKKYHIVDLETLQVINPAFVVSEKDLDKAVKLQKLQDVYGDQYIRTSRPFYWALALQQANKIIFAENH